MAGQTKMRETEKENRTYRGGKREGDDKARKAGGDRRIKAKYEGDQTGGEGEKRTGRERRVWKGEREEKNGTGKMKK